jgi:nucleoside-diphosphate-sugar epimerase
LSRFATAFLEDGKPVVFGDGNQTRDFTYVDNAVQANLLACEATGAAGTVFNIGTSHAISLNQVLELLRRISGKALQANYEPPRDGDIRDSLADISRAHEVLGYEPTVQFEEGLQRTFDWYRANHTKPAAK